MDAMPLNLARPEVPVELAALVAKMMAKEPERRFQTPKEVAQALLPFFKKGNVGAAGSRAEMSQVGRPDEGRVPTRVRTVPTQPATNRPPVPAPGVETPAAPDRPEPLWESLIELKENESSEPFAAVRRENGPQIPPWMWPAVAAGTCWWRLALACGSVSRGQDLERDDRAQKPPEEGRGLRRRSAHEGSRRPRRISLRRRQVTRGVRFGIRFVGPEPARNRHSTLTPPTDLAPALHHGNLWTSVRTASTTTSRS